MTDAEQGVAAAVNKSKSASGASVRSHLPSGAVHLSLPRSERGQRARPGVQLHTLNDPPKKSEVCEIAGLPVTRPERTIVDALATGAQPDQIQMAIRQTLERGVITPRRLRTAASRSSARVGKFIERSLEEAK